MRQRCYLKSHQHYDLYGGRGIKVCNEWENYAVFKEWALSNGYDITARRGKCTVDRIDNNGNYCPENCRIVNMIVQANNQNRKSRNVFVEYDGETKRLSEWAYQFEMCYETLVRRYRSGWTVKQMFETPSHTTRKKSTTMDYDGEENETD